MTEHRTEFRDRTITDTYCTEPGCEYEGQPAVQGHCFSRPDDVTEKYIARISGKAERALVEIKEVAEDDYMRHLESYFVSTMANWAFTLDEVIKLRRENAALRHDAEARAGR